MAPLPFFRSDEGRTDILAHAGFALECRAVAAWLAVAWTEIFDKIRHHLPGHSRPWLTGRQVAKRWPKPPKRADKLARLTLAHYRTDTAGVISMSVFYRAEWSGVTRCVNGSRAAKAAVVLTIATIRTRPSAVSQVRRLCRSSS